MVGTLMEVGRYKRKVDDITQILESKDRHNAGEAAGPNGLYLHTVHYDFSNLNPSKMDPKKIENKVV